MLYGAERDPIAIAHAHEHGRDIHRLKVAHVREVPQHKNNLDLKEVVILLLDVLDI